MREKAKDNLNQYIASALGEELRLRDVQELSRQRTNFLAKFGPEKLNDMSDEELLTQIPLNAVNDEPMDYWLEFKNDHDFEYSLFGGIGGGSKVILEGDFINYQANPCDGICSQNSPAAL